MSEAGTAGELLLMTSVSRTAAAAQTAFEKSPEAILVEAVRNGDREAFGRLYDLYAPMVHGILLARVPRSEVACRSFIILGHTVKAREEIDGRGSPQHR